MTIATNQLQKRLKNLTPEQIRKLMSGKKRSSAGKIPRMPRNTEQLYPLSRAQERLWFLAKLYPGIALYNIPIAINIKSGDIDSLRLSKVMNQIVMKNEIFRTTFHEKEGRVWQKIHPEFDVKIEFEDISQLDSTIDKEERIEQIGASHGNTIFELAKLPLLSVKLLKKGQNDHILFFNLHHLISDGWTNSLLARDSSLYYGSSENQSLEKATIQYVDYVKWEQEWLESSRFDSQLDFWKKELDDFPEPLRFPRDFQVQDHSFEGRTEHYEISSAVHEKVSIFCQKNGLTPYQFYISCYALLLARYTGELDIVVGTPVANRNQVFFQNTYGVFINSLPLRFKIDTALSFAALANVFKEMILTCMDNQEIPFSEIINAINPQRKLHENPLYNIHFAYQHFPQKDKNDEHSLLPIDYCTAKFDLNFWIKIAGDERTISVNYKHKLFGREKIRRFIEHYILLIESVVAQPQIAFRELDCIPQKHLSRLCGKTNEYNEISWIELFEKSAQVSPEVVAIVDDKGEISYRELHRQASSLAQALSRERVKKDDVVIIQTERNKNHIIAILACMKCGVTYLPIDKRIPPEKFTHILHDSQAKLVLTETTIEGVDCLGFESIHLPPSKGLMFENIAVQNEDIAYIIYTSGSTGSPKGVCVPHRALINYSHAMKKVIDQPVPISSFAHVSAFDADLGNTAIFLTLGFGGTLMIPPVDALVDPVLLANFFAKNPVDAIKIVPAHLNALKEQMARLLPRKVLIFAGDKLSEQLVSAVRQESPGLRIMNHYAPAEATISSLTYTVSVPSGRGSVPIGKPIDNTSVLLLDKDRNVVPRGGQGEICMTGVNIAQCYLNQPELTASRFINDRSLSSEKIYLTGDIGYINDDNHVVFLGRKDRQVKINGFRIEPGEIETVLQKHPAVVNCVVFITGEETAHTKLCAAVELQEPVEILQLKSFLGKHFSRVSIPAISILEKIPITRNGKVDGDSLRTACTAQNVVKRNPQPSDLVELQLTAIFKSILDVPMVSLDDQFFDLEGHSLLAISLIAKVNKAFKRNFPIATLFEYGSVRELAAHIRRGEKNSSGEFSPCVTLIEKKQGTDQETATEMIWAHPAGGNVMSYYPVANALGKTYTTRAFTAVDHHYKEKLSIKGMAAEYVGMLLDQCGKSKMILAGWSMGALIVHEMAINMANNRKVLPLILVDQPVPHPGAKNIGSYEDKLINYIAKIEIFAGETISLSATTGVKLDYALLRTEFIRLGLMPEDVTESNFRVFLDILVLHNRIVPDFLPSIYHGPTLLLKAADKLMLKTNEPQPEYFLTDLGWGDFCTDLTIIEVPGNHITMMTEKHAPRTAKMIQSWVSSLTTDPC